MDYNSFRMEIHLREINSLWKGGVFLEKKGIL